MTDKTHPDNTVRCTLSAPVFVPGMLSILLLLGFCVLWPSLAEQAFDSAQAWISASFGWYYVLAASAFLVCLVVIAASRFGDIRLGPDDATPEYSYTSWIAMLFAAGMGIGLLYFGVAEPMMHFAAPPTAAAQTPAAAQQAMSTTFFHWGLHAWGIYATVGLALAYFGFRYKLPLTLRSALYPLLRERIHGPLGHAVDSFALVSTVFGIATTLGYGVLQLSAGLQRVTGMDTSGPGFRYLAIAVVISLAGISAATGVGRGVKRLSELNLLLAIGLMLFVLFSGPTTAVLGAFSENLGNYLSEVVSMSFRTFAYSDADKQGWLSGWTLLYWAWWISWSPFVGLFIARISRGRTIREFVLGVLLVPTAFNFLWMSVFGNSAIWLDVNKAGGALSLLANNADTLLFNFLDLLPASTLSSCVALLLIVVFFVTSADSGALVLDGIASRGHPRSPVWQRLMWTLLLGLTAALLMGVGGLKALQSMTLIAALPFSMIMLAACAGLWRGLIADQAHTTRDFSPATSFWNGQRWRQRLDHLLHRSSPQDANSFITHTAQPALQELAGELQARGQTARVDSSVYGRIALIVPQTGSRDFVYGIQIQTRSLTGQLALDATPDQQPLQLAEPMTFFEDGRAGYDVQTMTREELLADVLRQFERYIQLNRLHATHLLNTAPGHSQSDHT